MSSDLQTAPPEVPAQSKPRRRRGSTHTSLSAHGEPMVWLTGGALAIALMMIVGLLVHVVWSGARTFWPMPVVRVELLDGQSHMGEISKVESFQPTPSMVSALTTVTSSLTGEDANAATAALDSLRDESQSHMRRQVRVGNFELTGQHFAWVPDYMVRPDGETLPEWAVVVERLSWGRFYGEPHRFVVTTQVSELGSIDDVVPDDNKLVELVLQDSTTKLRDEASDEERATAQAVREVWTSPAVAWAKFNEHHSDIRARWQEKVSLQEHVLGEFNRQRDDARLEVIDAELTYGVDSLQYEAAQSNYDAVLETTAEEAAGVEEQIRALDELNARFEIEMLTASGQVQPLALEEIVRAYPANQLGFFDKLGVYASRWREFLLDDPREANSEGGVFPAIWGTVAMTLLMSVLVVPFGVLAALYLREYAKAGPLVSGVRIAINNLAGVPSIVFGVFGLGFFCYNVGHFIDAGPHNPWAPPRWWVAAGIFVVIAIAGSALSAFTSQPIGTAGRRSRRAAWTITALWLAAAGLIVLLVVKTPYFDGFFRAKYVADNKATYGAGGLLWASLTLALLTLPVVIVATEEALAAVPGSMREGSYACGASKWQTIRRIVLPRAMPGIMTGMILAMARGAGEVAPLMLVGVLKLAPELPVDGVFPFVHPERSFMHLGFHIYDVGFQSQNSEAAKPMVYTTTLLLVGIIALLNVAAIALRTRLRRRFTSSQF